jgi:aryl-alcohol dehydrogenase-like predicted oxidoreductase
MQYRFFGKTGFKTSEIGLGCWQIGGDWGDVSEKTAEEILESALENGVNFFDTADVYGGGRSETIIGNFFKKHQSDVFIASKVGRDGSLYPDRYTEAGVRKCIEASLQRLSLERLDLIQLHCIPFEIMEDGEVFEWLRKFRREGLIKDFGASVESMDEAILCMEQDELCSLQIIFNIFRQKPTEKVLQKANEKKVGIIVRLPLASGLLTGKLSRNSTFASNDHRHYNRDGKFFNVGETFAGLPFIKGVELSRKLQEMVPGGMTLTEMAIRWILDFRAVSVIIPGASRPEQVRQNTAISELPPLNEKLHYQLTDFYEKEVKIHIRGPY